MTSIREYSKGETGKKVVIRRNQQSVQLAANSKAEKPSHLLQQAITIHAVGTNRPEPVVISTALPTVQPFSLEGFFEPISHVLHRRDMRRENGASKPLLRPGIDYRPCSGEAIVTEA